MQFCLPLCYCTCSDRPPIEEANFLSWTAPLSSKAYAAREGEGFPRAGEGGGGGSV
jgi:hypothetical protein